MSDTCQRQYILRMTLKDGLDLEQWMSNEYLDILYGVYMALYYWHIL